MKPLQRSVSQAFAALLALTGCASIERDCSSCNASNFGSDWIVLQYGMDGRLINCWELRNTAIDNEYQADGIYWQEQSGHLVHIGGWYNRVQVTNNDWAGAAKAVGVEDSRCKDGAYVTDVDGGKGSPAP